MSLVRIIRHIRVRARIHPIGNGVRAPTQCTDYCLAATAQFGITPAMTCPPATAMLEPDAQ